MSSNSTVSELAFNSSSSELSFTVSGPSGTTGFVDVAIAKNLVSNITDLKVYLDGNQLNYTATSTSDSWLLHFTYSHSTHSVVIDLQPVFVTEFTPTTVLATLLIVMATIMILSRKSSSEPSKR